MDENEKASIAQLWQVYMLTKQQREAQQAAASAQSASGPGVAPGSSSTLSVGSKPSGDSLTSGAHALARDAQSQVAPPAGFGDQNQQPAGA
jgi:hypothetical protein